MEEGEREGEREKEKGQDSPPVHIPGYTIDWLMGWLIMGVCRVCRRTTWLQCTVLPCLSSYFNNRTKLAHSSRTSST